MFSSNMLELNLVNAFSEIIDESNRKSHRKNFSIDLCKNC